MARALPDVVEGRACAGTALESRTFRTREKAFLFLERTRARLKLAASAAEARALGFTVGAQGWTTLPLDALPTAAVAKRWVRESHGLVAGPATGKIRARMARPKS